MKRRRLLTGAVAVLSLIAWIFTVLIWIGVNYGGPGHGSITIGNKSTQIEFYENERVLANPRHSSDNRVGQKFADGDLRIKHIYLQRQSGI